MRNWSVILNPIWRGGIGTVTETKDISVYRAALLLWRDAFRKGDRVRAFDLTARLKELSRKGRMPGSIIVKSTDSKGEGGYDYQGRSKRTLGTRRTGYRGVLVLRPCCNPDSESRHDDARDTCCRRCGDPAMFELLPPINCRAEEKQTDGAGAGSTSGAIERDLPLLRVSGGVRLLNSYQDEARPHG